MSRLRDALPAVVLALLGLGGLLVSASSGVGGALVLPLDDAYIHLGVARSLVESGTWGVNPGELASASSSPLWTLLLAAGLGLGTPPVVLALALKGLAGLGALALGARWLEDEGLVGPPRALALCGLVLAVPLPLIMGLGMEHTLHLALVLALARAGERDRGLALAALAALAVLARYESLFVCGWMSAGLWWAGRRGAAAAVLAGALAATLGFGLVCAQRGGPWVPASLLLKTPVGHEMWAGVRSNLEQGAPLLALAALVAAWPASELHRQRARLFVAAGLSHLLLARVGWMFRYEAWLMGWGALLLAPALRRAWPVAGARLALVVLAAPLLARSAEALRLYVPGVVFNAHTDVVIARWVADQWPDARVATQDLGALALFTDSPLTDLSGLGDTEVLRLRQAGRWTGEAASALMERRGVDLAITGEDWMSGDRPAVFTPLGSLEAPWEFVGASTRLSLWAVSNAARREAPARLDALEASLPPGVRLIRVSESAIDLEGVSLTGAAVQQEGSGIAFYTNGAARFTLPVSGRLRVTVVGSPADGRGPRYALELHGQPIHGEATDVQQRLDLGWVEAGESVVVVYDDDRMDAQGGDRNLWLKDITVDPVR